MRRLNVVLGALLVMTALTVVSARFVHLPGEANLFLAVGIAIAKSSLVLLVFMGLAHGAAINKVVLFFCLMTIATFLGFTMIDMTTRGLLHPASASLYQQPTIALEVRMNVPEVAEGKALFVATCAACHGAMGQGLPGLGKDMQSSEFIASQNDNDLLFFLRRGRDPGDPTNTTGVGMPARGGDPTMNNEKLRKVIMFIRAIRPYTGESGGGADAH